MTLLTPLGLLGLLSIIVLIIIYIIKPNYQQKFISSTYVWKLSLKYKKKKIPISKLRNILLIICQVLILISCALTLAQPATVYRETVDNDEVIVIIDASASMLATSPDSNDETRFTRAVNEAIADVNQIFGENGLISIILADESPEYLFQRVTQENKDNVVASLEELIIKNSCSYSSADMDYAMSLTESVLLVNPSAKIKLYTDSQYNYVPDGIELVNVADESEWNAAILNATTEVVENFYEFTVEVGMYAQDREITVNLSVEGINGLPAGEGYFECEYSVDCYDGESQKIVFYFEDPLESGEDSIPREDTESIKYVDYYCSINGENVGIYSFESAFITITAGDEPDSYDMDDMFQIYSRDKDIIDVVYVSPAPLIFIQRLFLTDLPQYYGHRWQFNWTQVRVDGTQPIPTEGYDFYIYESALPQIMPTDGIVMIINPKSAPTGCGYTYLGESGYLGAEQYLGSEMFEHPLAKDIEYQDIFVTSYNRLNFTDPSYQTLFSVAGGEPAIAFKDEGVEKVVIMNFPTSYSNITVTEGFPYFFRNVFEYFYPETIVGGKNAFELNDTVQFESRSDSILVTGPNSFEEEYISFPAEITVTNYGTYTFMQTTAYGVEKTDKIFVRLPVKESQINRVEDALKNPYTEQVFEELIDDYLFYIAIAMLALLAAEWLLYSKENI